MLLLFLKERSAWILFFIILLGWMNASFLLDRGFSGISILYFNGISLLLFSFFLLWRYFIEINQLKKLCDFLGNSELDGLRDLPPIHELSPFEEKYIEIFYMALQEKEDELSKINMRLLEETDELLAWVHEVKAPLTAMRLMLDHVEDRKVHARLEKEWLRIYLLLDQQLHNTRLSSIEKDNRMEEVEVHQVIVNEIRDLQSWCLEKGIGFDLERLNLRVITDKKWLAFIIRQILTNAVKYSEPASEIAVYSEMDSEGHAILHVKDTGIGIQPADLGRVFQRTYTGTVGRESSASSGMGLYLAKNAADKLGIRISVQSVVGKGSVFTLIFPIENEYVKTIGR